MRLCNAPAGPMPREWITFHGKEWQLFVRHGCQGTISEKTLCECACLCTGLHLFAQSVSENPHASVCARLAYTPLCKSFCIHALMVKTTGKGCVHAHMYFLWPTGNFGYIWPAAEKNSWLPVMFPSIHQPKVVEQTTPTEHKWFYSHFNTAISHIRSNNRLATHEPIPSAFWPTCYWEMTCFPKLHHEAEMINGLKSDKRIWSGLLFPAYFNHVVMKWI